MDGFGHGLPRRLTISTPVYWESRGDNALRIRGEEAYIGSPLSSCKPCSSEQDRLAFAPLLLDEVEDVFVIDDGIHVVGPHGI